MRKALLFLPIIVLLCVSPGARCGSDEESQLPAVEDPFPTEKTFHINGEADRYAGPSPHKVQFAAEAYNAAPGDVKWFWSFEDGTTSTKQNPTHTFSKPGYYLVNLEAQDTKKTGAARALYLGIWPPKVWRDAQKGLVNQAAEARKNRIRTNARRRQLRETCRKDPACARALEKQKEQLRKGREDGASLPR